MTHDELLAEINRLDSVLTDSYGMSALRAVVELHKPQPTSIPTDLKCTECSGLDWADYPCATIRSIEKELG